MSTQAHRRWWVKFPGGVYATGLWRARGRADLRRQVLEWLKAERLPRGTEMWEQVGPAFWERR